MVEEPMFRGTGVLPVIALFIKKHGLKNYHLVVSSLTEKYQVLYQHVSDLSIGKNYPEESHAEMLEQIGKQFYSEKSPDEWLPEYMYYQMNYGMNTFSKIFVRLAAIVTSPGYFAQMTMKFWRLYHNSGNYYFIDGGSNDLTMVLKNFIGYEHPIYHFALKHAFISALQLSKAKNVTCDVRKIKKDKSLEFFLQWR